MKEDEIILNGLSQSRRQLADGISWFSGLPVEERRLAIRKLSAFILQAHATPEEVDKSIRLSGVKATMTPAVLLARGPLSEALAKVGNLPEAEMEKSFRVLISLLSVADARRRSVDCVNGCSHSWHNME